MRKMSGGREKLQLHTMNGAEFSWAWKRIVKGVISPFSFSQKCQLLGSSEAPNRVPSKVKRRAYLRSLPGAGASVVPAPSELCPFRRSSIFISKVCKPSGVALFKMMATKLIWLFNFKFELIERK